MAIKNIIQIGEELLREKCNPVLLSSINEPGVQALVEDLIDTHRQRQGIGIAAPQIGINLRFFVTELPISPNRPESQSDELRIYFNPEITFRSDELVTMYEGCLSIADGNFCLPITRPKEITIEAYNKAGQKFKLHCDGLLARVIQHEYDHLEGILFIDKNVDIRKAVSISHSRTLSTTDKSIVKSRTITVKEITLL